MVSSSINKAKLKREKLMKNAQHYKNVLRTWEAAVSKAEGRIPGKVCTINDNNITTYLIILYKSLYLFP